MAAIVAAVDFSKASRKAFDAAVRLAKDLDATLVLVHARTPLPKVGARGPIDQVKAEIEAEEWQAMVKDWAGAARKTVKAETFTRKGKPPAVIAAAVAEHGATMVVVGSHGRTGLKRAVLGSVAEAVVRKSKVPVVVVPS